MPRSYRQKHLHGALWKKPDVRLFSVGTVSRSSPQPLHMTDYQVPSNKNQSGSWYLDRKQVLQFLEKGPRYSWWPQFKPRKEKKFQQVLERVEDMDIWRCEGDKLTTTNLKSQQPFNDIFRGLEKQFSEHNFKTTDFIENMTEYYHLLFDQNQIDLVSVAFDAAINWLSRTFSCLKAVLATVQLQVKSDLAVTI